MRKAIVGLVAAMVAVGWAAPAASAGCQLSRLLELPVTMEGHVALVRAAINGKPALFQLDSGAFYSTMSEGATSEFGLKRVPTSLEIVGVGGATTASLVTVKTFDLGAFHIPDLQFLVTGNEFGHAGLIGQNFLAQFDVEYDLARGVIRLYRDKDCAQTSIAYWAAANFSMEKVQPDAVDSRALVWFRKGDLVRARADYDVAIAARPKAASSLYMRGVVERQAGDGAAAEKDLVAAKAIDPEAGREVRAWGIRP